MNDDVINFNGTMDKHRQGMVLEGRTFTDLQMTEQLLRGLSVTGAVNAIFTACVNALNLRFMGGNASVSPTKVMHETNSVYQNLLWQKTWKEAPKKAISLTTKTESIPALKKRNAALATKIDELSNKVGVGGEPVVRNWQYTKVGDIAYHPQMKEKYVWCTQHGTKSGCYMKAPHDHEKWAAKKAANPYNKNKKARVAATTVTTNDGDKKPAAKPTGSDGKLKLNSNVQAALTTSMQARAMTNSEIEEILMEVDGQFYDSPKE
jgi:hypothetical protein